jgi:hypothetical protein
MVTTVTESQPTGYGESPDTTDGTAPATDDAEQGSGELTTDDAAQRDDGVARPGNDASDRGERDTTLTTDDDAQEDDAVARPGNSAD